MITTKTGDKGQTTCGNKRVDKDDLLVEVVGNIDELQAVLGIAKQNPSKSLPSPGDLWTFDKGDFTQIQKDLIKINGELACGSAKHNQWKERIKFFENEIERIEKELPEFKEFIIPGKNETEAFLHLARTVCRRTERRIVSLNKTTKLNPNVLKYFNRLSDYLFILSRII